MLPTYRAILRNGHLEWGNEGGPVVSPDQPIPVHVTLLASESLPPVTGPAMAAALTDFAATGGPSCFDDPVEWQQESRPDRDLPGRGE